MSSKGKGQKPSVPVRRSARERKVASFGSDFEQDDPALGSEPKPAKPSRRTTPGRAPGKKPSTGDNPPQPADDDPQPDPVPKGKFTWPADVEHWQKDTLPRNHSKRLYIIQKRLHGIQKRP